MNAITFPNDLQAWAEAEVEAGRAESVEQVATKALLGYRAALEDFRRSLDEAEAEADRDGWLSVEEVFGPIEAELLAKIDEEDRQQQAASTVR